LAPGWQVYGKSNDRDVNFLDPNECIALPGNPLHMAEGSLAKAHAILPLRRAAFKAALA
jgi:hypothetical protein